MTKITNTYYGILDNITNEGLSEYDLPIDKLGWAATIDNGKFHRFSSLDEALKACHYLTELFRKDDKDCEFAWEIVTITEKLALKRGNHKITVLI